MAAEYLEYHNNLTDIPLILSSDGTSLDWANPIVLAQPVPDSQDVETYILMLLTTDRAAPLPFHYGLQPIQRRGTWTDSFNGEFGALFWLGVEMNQWSSGSKLAQIQRWAEQALQTIADENLILQPATVNVFYTDSESVQIDVSVIVADGRSRTITYVLGT